MKTILERWNRYLEQAQEDFKSMCPEATQNLELNTKIEMRQFRQNIFSTGL